MRKARVALIGLGGWGAGNFRSLEDADTVELVTWFDSNPEVVEKFRGDTPVSPASSWEEVLSNEEIEGVILVVPNHIHTPLAIEAAGRGKHVWVEKPISNTTAEADAIIQACEDAGVILQVGHSLRLSPGIRLVKKMIEDGKIGDPVMVEGHNSHRGGWSLAPGVWRWYNTTCPGGPMNLLGIHLIDTVHYLFGPSAEVTGMMTKKYLECEPDEITAAIIRFKSNLLGVLGSSYVSPGGIRIAVYGATGKLEFDYLKNQLTYTDIDGKSEVMQTESINPVTEEYREFGECIVTGKKPETGGLEGRAAVAVLEAAITSARTGKAVRL